MVDPVGPVGEGGTGVAEKMMLGIAAASYFHSYQHGVRIRAWKWAGSCGTAPLVR